MPEIEPFIIRVSGLTGWPDCERRSASRMFYKLVTGMGYELRHLDNGIGAAVGTAVHAGAAISLNQKLASGELGPEDEATDAARDSLKEGTSGGLTWDRETPEIRVAEGQVLRMTKAYREQVVPQITPIYVEERFEATVPWTVQPIVLSGQGDVNAREKQALRDLKTSTRLGSHAPQIGGYSLLGRSNGLDIPEAVVDWVPRKSLNHPQPAAVIQKYDISAAETAAVNIIRHIDEGLTTFIDGDAQKRVLPGDAWVFTANPSSMLCGEKYCPAYGVKGPHSFCHEWEPKALDKE